MKPKFVTLKTLNSQISKQSPRILKPSLVLLCQVQSPLRQVQSPLRQHQSPPPPPQYPGRRVQVHLRRLRYYYLQVQVLQRCSIMYLKIQGKVQILKPSLVLTPLPSSV